jgi:hypothetical protein
MFTFIWIVVVIAFVTKLIRPLTFVAGTLGLFVLWLLLVAK